MIDLAETPSPGNRPTAAIESTDTYTIKLADTESAVIPIATHANAQTLATEKTNDGISQRSKQKIRIMPIGDSITYGVIDSHNNTESGGYRTYLWKMLTSNGYDVDFIGSQANGPDSIDRSHEGYRGKTINQIVELVSNQIADKKPDVVLLLAGTNDILRDIDLNDAPKRLTTLIDRIIAKSPQTTVLVGTLPPSTKFQDDLQQIKNFNAVLVNLIDRKLHQGKKVELVDLNDNLTNNDLSDRVHPTTQGYRKMAQAWYESLTDLLNPINDANSPDDDPLTGNIFTFSGSTRKQALQSSVLVDNHFDRLFHFNQRQGDRIQLDFDDNLATVSRKERPAQLFYAGIQRNKSLKQATKAAYEDIPLKGNHKLRANQAVIFKHKEKFYLSVNNNRPGFQAQTDLFVDLGTMTRTDFAPGDFRSGPLTVTDYFV